MKTPITLLLVALLPLSAWAGSNRLIGKWKSNKQATLAYLKTHTQLTSQQLDKVGTALGKVTLTFTATNMTMVAGDWKSVTPYRIVSNTAKSMTLDVKDPQTKKTTQAIFEFDGNGFWTPDDKIPGYKERFEKLLEK